MLRFEDAIFNCNGVTGPIDQEFMIDLLSEQRDYLDLSFEDRIYVWWYDAAVLIYVIDQWMTEDEECNLVLGLSQRFLQDSFKFNFPGYVFSYEWLVEFYEGMTKESVIQGFYELCDPINNESKEHIVPCCLYWKYNIKDEEE